MPTISVDREELFRALGRNYSEEEFSDLCFDFGLEVDDEVAENESEEGKIRVEIPANRYDLLCIEGLIQGLLVFLGRMKMPRYSLVQPPKDSIQRMTVKVPTQQIRPFVVCAVLRNIHFNEKNYDSFIDLQDKLHHNLCRKRTLVSMGTHDLDTIKGPFVYDALPPNDIRFRPLKQVKEYSAAELMELYSTDAQLKHFLHIIRDSPVFPIIYDSNGTVLSMPPIINSHHTRITLDTKNVFIEVTATDFTKVNVVLDTLVCMFSRYCEKPYSVEMCQVETCVGNVEKYPLLPYRTEVVPVEKVNNCVGISLPAPDLSTLLTRMSLETRPDSTGSNLEVLVPPTRHDVIHACDIYEDAAIAHGYNNVPKRLPSTATVARQLPLNKMGDQLREGVAQAGFSEALTFALCSRDDISAKLRHDLSTVPAVHVGNPKTLEFQVARTTLLPGLLKTIAANKKMALPLRLFEVSDVILKDIHQEVGARNERHICAINYNKTPGFEIIHGLLDRVMQLLEVKPGKGNGGYYLRSCDDPTYFPGRCAEILAMGSVVGKLGVLHPEVVTKFELNLPCAAMEINIEPFL